MHIEQFLFNSFQTRCCVVWGEGSKCAIIDPGCYSEQEITHLTDFIESKGLEPVCIMLTHCHFDHIYGMSALAKEYEIPVYAHFGEMYTIEKTNPEVCKCYGLPLPETFPMIKTIREAAFNSRFIPVTKLDTIEVGDLRFNVIETPGHSRGGVCYYSEAERVLFCGDTLFAGAIGRTDHPGGDYDVMMKSIFENIMPLDDSKAPVKVIPGHGPCTDLTTEGMTNPFLMPFNEPYED